MMNLGPIALLKTLGAGCALMVLTFSAGLASERIEIESLEADRLSVSAEAATPLEVLRALSEQVGFDLSLPESPPVEEPVNLRMTGRIGDLLPRLLPSYNLMLRSRRDDSGQSRLYKVIVLNGGVGAGQDPLPAVNDSAPVTASVREAGARSQIIGGPTDSRGGPTNVRGGPATPLTPEMLQRAEQQREDILRRLGRSNN
ncbi:hypothetical protein [Limibacillus halophilus]|uniref:Uncharacterized protein n=1 Tax=Limibacillus halophilus TaxID=1579333 RepID=A0A839SSF4_9PROT|nr:hypothetical protein [Limibacillus halophilus]MBB3064714.1 hypothetical protein [Limibacillus halophilus]